MVTAFAEEKLEDIKDGRVLYEYLVIENNSPKIRWLFLEDKYPIWEDFKEYSLNNHKSCIDEQLKDALRKLSDEEICQRFSKYFSDSKYVPEWI